MPTFGISLPKPKNPFDGSLFIRQVEIAEECLEKGLKIPAKHALQTARLLWSERSSEEEKHRFNEALKRLKNADF